MPQEEVHKYDKICEEAYVAAKKETAIHNRQWLDSPWTGFFEGKDPMTCGSTGVEEETLRHIAEKFSQEPGDDFTVHGGLKRILKNRGDMASRREADWAMGEAFAVGSLLKEGIHVRLSGQDVERGTFRYLTAILYLLP